MYPMRSDRKLRRVTTFGDSVHLAPFGAAGMGMWKLSPDGTDIEKASDFPSGAHSTADGASVRCEICVTAPSASIQRTKICWPPGSPFAMYAMRLPSGDHFTSEPCTSDLWWDPSAF